MPALTQLIKRSMSGTSLTNAKKSERQPGQTLASAEARCTLKFEDYYMLDRRLSKGSFGVVYVAQHTLSSQEYAVKIIERAKLLEKEKQGVEREVSILKDCRDVENIVQLVDFFSSPEHFYVVQVYAKGGDVFERLAQRTHYTENDARNLARHLLKTVGILHARKLAHRDLKPENLLLSDFLDDSSIVVADFGFASYVPKGGLKTRCGTPAFVGPEVLVPNCRYDERCDMWSVGCLLYMLIAGYPPFQDKTHRGLFKKVRGADYVFHEAYWKNVSVPAKQLIASLLTVDPKYRCTAREALESSKWLTLDEHLLKAHDLSASLGEIKKFHARRTLKGAMHAVITSVKQKFKSAGDVDFSNHSEEDWEKEGTSADLNEEGFGLSRDPLVKANSDSFLKNGGRTTVSFDDVYEIGELIHSGQSTKVYECLHRQTCVVFAVKVIKRNVRSRKSVKKTMAETVLREVAILDSLKHKNIIQIIEIFEDEDHFFLIMERMKGGDLFDRISQLKKYTEKDARTVAKTLFLAMQYCHAQKLVHRDLKPQNLLLKSKDDPTDIIIAGFGFACRVHMPLSLTTRCGTPSYVAPEVLKNAPYDQSVDMWSIGVIIYVLLCGYPPFVHENQSELFRKIRMSELKFQGEEWESVSKNAKDLIRNLLVANPMQRFTAKQALQSDWLRGEVESPIESKLAAMAEVHNDRQPRRKKFSKSFKTKPTVRDATKTEAVVKQIQVGWQPVTNQPLMEQEKFGSAHQAGGVEGKHHAEVESQPRKHPPMELRMFEC